jgi:hypothetical protein
VIESGPAAASALKGVTKMPELRLLGIVLPQWFVTAFALVVWIALIGIVFRMVILRTHERLRCPLHDRMARVTLLRGPDGMAEDVVRCSLVGREALATCGKVCLRSARA